MSGHMILQVWQEAAESIDGIIYPRSVVEANDDYCIECDKDSGFCECHVESVGERWFARYSAPGYMDQTEPVSSNEGPIDAAQACFNQYGDDTPGSDDRRELAQFIRQARAQGFRS